MLSALDTDKVCFLITKLREFGVQVEENTGGGSDASDDKFVAVFNDDSNTSVKAEIEDFLAGMDIDERLELIALGMVGREDYAPRRMGRRDAGGAIPARTLNREIPPGGSVVLG